MRILVVEDDDLVADLICEILVDKRYHVVRVNSGEQAIDHCAMNCYNAMILDIGLPNMDGNQVIKTLRSMNIMIPILVVSAKSHIENKLQSLDQGADDFMIKPFHKKELVARIHALIRRNEKLKNHIITCKNLRIDIKNKQVKILDQLITLTPKEYHMLEIIAIRKGRPVSKLAIMNHLYGGDMDEPDLKIIDVFACTLRKKLTKVNQGINCIETIWGRGYMMPDIP